MAVTRLVVHANPEGKETPLLLLAELRLIDPLVELVYFGASDWRLGAVRPNAYRAEKGQMILDMEARRPIPERNHKNHLLALLLRQGFAQIALYVVPPGGDVSGTVHDAEGNPTSILTDFKLRDHFYRLDQGEQIVTDTVAADSPDARAAASQKNFGHYMATEGRAHYAREARGKKTFGYGGMSGHGSKLLSRAQIAPLVTGDAVLNDLQQIMAELGSDGGSLL